MKINDSRPLSARRIEDSSVSDRVDHRLRLNRDRGHDAGPWTVADSPDGSRIAPFTRPRMGSMTIRVETLGGLRILRDGEELTSLPGKPVQCALLVYLAVERSATRDQLLTLLWPEKSVEKARGSLNNTVYELRSELGQWVQLSGDTLRTAEWVTSDAAEISAPGFEAGRDVDSVIPLGDFLDGTHVGATSEFESWVDRQRRTLNRIQHDLQKAVVTRVYEDGDISKALRTAREWADRRPLDDEAQYWVIRLAAEAGHRGDAVARFEAFETLLLEEFDAKPQEDLVALVERIRQAEVSGDVAAGFEDITPREREPIPRTPDDSWRPEEGWLKKLVTALSLYMVPAAGLLQVLDYLIDYVGLPRTFFPAAMVLILFGIPIVAVTAFLESQPVLRRDLKGLQFLAARWFSWRNAALGAMAALAAWSAAVLGWLVVGNPTTPELDRNGVVVFPFVERGADALATQAGETAALRIVSALERTDPLRAYWGWSYLDVEARRDIRTLTPFRADSIAEAVQARYYVMGDVVVAEAGASVVLRLHDARTDSLLQQQTRSSASADSVSQLGLYAMRDLLPRFLEPGRSVDPVAYQDRDIAAAALWMQGEMAYLRSQFDVAYGLLTAATDRDPAMSMASLRAALAANWLDRDTESVSLVDEALAYSGELPARYTHFATGFRAYLTGDADGALADLDRALELDPDWADAWMIRGEVHQHLLPLEWPRDSLAQEAFLRAREHDPDLTPALFHLTEHAVWRGDLDTARERFELYSAVNPDSSEARHLTLMLECADRGSERTGWVRAARENPGAVLQASHSLGRTVGYRECAKEGFQAYLGESAGTVAGEWGALLALTFLHAADGNEDRARAVLDQATTSGRSYARHPYVYVAASGFEVGPWPSDYIDGLTAPVSEASSVDLWNRGLWAVGAEDLETLREVAVELDSRAAADDASPRLRLFADIMNAHLTRLHGDHTGAIDKLMALRPVAARAEISWQLWDGLATERIALAELLVEADRNAEALAVTSEFLRPPAVTYMLFRPQALALRARAAAKLGAEAVSDDALTQLAQMGRMDLMQAQGLPNTGGRQ